MAAALPPGQARLTKRAALVSAMELKHYEFNAHGVELGQFYESGAVVSDGSRRPEPGRDPELYYEPSTVPGSRLREQVEAPRALRDYGLREAGIPAAVDVILAAVPPGNPAPVNAANLEELLHRAWEGREPR